MPVSKPMKLMTLRIPEEEKARLERLAADQHITLSHALREGAKLMLDDATPRRTRSRVAT